MVLEQISDSVPVPYLGGEEDYFVGNGVVGAVSDISGRLNMLIGCDYTCPSFLQEERLLLTVDGYSVPINFHMHRLRHSGVFAGQYEYGGICVKIYDFTIEKEPVFHRLAVIQNVSDRAHRVQLQAVIRPGHDETNIKSGMAVLRRSKGCWCFGNAETKNWADRYCEIFFSGGCDAVAGFQQLTVYTLEHTLTSGAGFVTTLCHYHYYAGDRDSEMIQGLSSLNAVSQLKGLHRSVEQWNKWLDTDGFYPLFDAYPEEMDIVEGCLVAVRTQQNRDGGFIAGIHKYANSYIRDSHGCFRLLMATGHWEECRRLIQNIHSRWEIAGYIPNWWSMGSDTFIGDSFVNNASEITAYYLFMLRDYWQQTGDASLVEDCLPSAIWAADAQLTWMLGHGYLMNFNGDETEQYVSRSDGEEYGGFPAVEGWDGRNDSFPSTVAALASLSFLSDFFQETGRQDPYQPYLDTIRTAVDSAFLEPDTGCHAWARDAVTHKRLQNVMTNFRLLPVWLGARLANGGERQDALSTLHYRDPDTGFLPNAYPDNRGFCGHSLALLLYDLVKLEQAVPARDVYRTIRNSPLLSCWGTVSEFYGPGGVANGHGYRGFESGILGEAVLAFLQSGFASQE